MPLPPQYHFSLSQAVVILGLCRNHVERLIAAGRLRATNQPHPRPRNSRWRISRDDLVDYMVANGYSPETYRGPFAPEKGALVWMGKPRDLDWAKLRPVDPTYCRSAYKLGRVVSFTPTWGIVMDAGCVNGWLRLAREIREDRYCPLMIALTSTPRQARLAARVFDLVIPRPFRSTAEVAAALARFRDQRSVVPRAINARGNRFTRHTRGGRQCKKKT